MKQFAAKFAILLIIIQAVYASFGVCVVSQYYLYANKNVVGFNLWNDQGDNGSQYRSIYAAGKTDMQNNGWKIHLTFGPPVLELSGIKSISVYSDTYGEIGAVNTTLICERYYSSPTGAFRVYYTCFDSTNENYCTQERIDYESGLCRTSTSLGSDSDSC